MIKVKNIMTRDIISISPDMEIAHAAKLLLDKHINGVPVVNDKEKLVGILCQSDLITQQKNIPIPSFFTLLEGFIPLTSMKNIEKEVKKISAITVNNAMNPNPVTVNSESSVEEVAALMVDKHFHTIPVVDQDKLVGIIGKEDVLKTLMSESE
ncbi:CBS domain-containing protein [Candidatus Magnetomoraceae bacterium gMMP-1]